MPWLAAAALVAALALCAARGGAAPGPRCTELAKQNHSHTSSEQLVSVNGQQRPVLVYASAGPPRAAAALLLALLHHGLRYSEPRLAHGPRTLAHFTDHLLKGNNTLAVLPAVMWRWRSDPTKWCDSQHDGFCGLGGPPLVVVGAGAGGAAAHAHVFLAAAARARPDCARASSWAFYSDEDALRNCNFDVAEYARRVTVFVSAASGAELRDLWEVRALLAELAGAALPLRLQAMAWPALADRVRDAGSSSFVFVDWDMWQRAPGVAPMRAPPAACARAPAATDHVAVSVRAASEVLFKYAPKLISVARKFAPEPDELREILEYEARAADGDIEEAACHWATHHQARVNRWLYAQVDKIAVVFFCQEDSEFQYGTYAHVTRFMEAELWNITKDSEFGIRILNRSLSCRNETEVLKEIKEFTHSTQYYATIGLVTGGDAAETLDKTAKAHNLPMISYALSAEGVHSVAGGVADIAAVLLEFITANRWKRIAVLSDDSRTASDLVRKLRSDHLCMLDKVMTVNDTERVLRELLTLDVRVVLLNMRAAAALEVLRRAARAGMTPTRGYVWMSREWGGEDAPADMRVLAVAAACRTPQAGSRAALRAQFERAWGDRWPPRAAAYADALLTLGLGFNILQRDEPKFKDDLHGVGYYSAFWKGLSTTNESGVCQRLRYEGASLAESLVFMEEWTGNSSADVAMWSAARGRVLTPDRLRAAFPAGAPGDGTPACAVLGADCFSPRCYDVPVALVSLALLLILVLVPYLAVRVRSAFRRRCERIEFELRQNEAIRRDQVVLSLAGYLIPREQLELRQLLGSGRSGRVHLALLRAPDRKPRAVAAKSLRESSAPSEESEFLREACIIASLDHAHVVRLVGVCTGDPLLVLMEHAFFGDLLRYLRSRRHLVEGVDADASADEAGVGPEEAAHVSAEALTRLVREAAAALAYLAHRGLVHRDVRAANCLVDARRSLKLADFGMAREVRDDGAGGDAEYACRRRGMFPVLWMAPESLERGAFSAASDVWSLGVLVLEVVTLGARPYGSWPPLRVLQYVARGGRPRLPLDATAQTRGVAHECWRREARARPPASALVAYLAEHPRALAPALAPDWDAPDVDSGYGAHEAADARDSFDRPSPDSGTALFPAECRD